MDDSTIRKTIASNLTQRRKELGLTQVQMASSLNYSERSWRRRETGEVSIGFEEFPAIQQVLQIDDPLSLFEVRSDSSGYDSGLF